MNNAQDALANRGAMDRIFASGGEMGALMRSMDWSKTPLGLPEHWPQSLQTMVSTCLMSRFPILIWWGSQYIKIYNDAYRPILGELKHPEAMGSPGKIVWGEIWDIIGPMLDGVFYQSESTWSEDQMLPMDRYGFTEECYFTFSYSPIYDESGGVGGIFTAVTETTQKVLSDRRLRTLRDLGQSAMEGSTVAEATGFIMDVIAANPLDMPFAMLYRVDEDDNQQVYLDRCAGLVPGMSISPHVIADFTNHHEPPAWPLAETMAAGGAVIVKDLPALYGDIPTGPWSEVPHTAVVLPILSPANDATIGFLIVGVSARLLLDEDYLSFYGLVANHTATAIANAQAYDAERQRAEAFEELDRAKTVFFSNISHEFRTPLTLILGPLEELLNGQTGNLPHAQSSMILLVQRNALRLLKMVNTLLDFSRLEAGRAETAFEATDLSALTTDLASMFRPAIERAGLRLIVDCAPLPEPIYIDRDMWEKIVLNLLSNAFKFTFEGEIEVKLTLLPGRVELTVRDTGVGIAEAELPNVFKRFYRVHNARGRTYEGSGIGLALVNDLVRLHGGTISVVSQEGQGTTFTVSILRGSDHLAQDRIGIERSLISTALGATPFVTEAMRWLGDEPKLDTGEVLTASSKNDLPVQTGIFSGVSVVGRPGNIVVVDDNADMRAYLLRLLSNRWRVDAYADGQSALEAILDRPPDLVISDVMMPGLSGLELIQALRNNAPTDTLPIILLSARAGEESTVSGLETGANDYLVKPFSARELLARVTSQLDMAHLRREIQHYTDDLAQREQNQRTARDLHTSASQTLFSAGALIEAATLVWENPDTAREHLNQIKLLMQAAIEEMRLLGGELSATQSTETPDDHS